MIPIGLKERTEVLSKVEDLTAKRLFAPGRTGPEPQVPNAG